MLIAQITDFHIKAGGRLSYGVVDTAVFLRRAIDALNSLDPQPDVVLATGDLVDFGRSEEYAVLREILSALRMPIYLIPGNHDDREAMMAAFPDHDYLRQSGGPYLHYTIDRFPVRLIGLDTTVPRAPGGMMGEERLAWLDARLSEKPQWPTILFMHHPPYDVGITHMDIQRMADSEALARVITRHPQVERILCGHLHRPTQARFAGTIASTAPSTAHQVALDLRVNGPSAFVMEPAGYQLHLWNKGNLVTHSAFTGRYEGPFPFYEDGKLID